MTLVEKLDKIAKISTVERLKEDTANADWGYGRNYTYCK